MNFHGHQSNAWVIRLLSKHEELHLSIAKCSTDCSVSLLRSRAEGVLIEIEGVCLSRPTILARKRLPETTHGRSPSTQMCSLYCIRSKFDLDIKDVMTKATVIVAH